MLDDDSGFGEITVEICMRTLPQFLSSAICENGAMQTAAARGDVAQGEYTIRRPTGGYAVSYQCPIATIRLEFPLLFG